MNKPQAFEYVHFKLVNWYGEDKKLELCSDFNEDNDLSKLKALKLLFFLCGANVELLSTFNNFYAMPYGPVESDIYKNINSDAWSEIFSISNEKTTVKIKKNDKLRDIRDIFPVNDITISIDKAINTLKNYNTELIQYNAISLVDLSHKWQSWKTMFQFARRNHKYSTFIPIEAIEKETKIFHLS